jgi:hypothetical protein
MSLYTPELHTSRLQVRPFTDADAETRPLSASRPPQP